MHTEPVEVVIAVTHQEWAGRLATWIADHADDAHLRDHHVFYRGDALEHDYDCLVCDADSSLLDTALVRELHRRGRTVVGVTDAHVPHGQQRLEDLGVDRGVDKTASAAEMAAVIVDVARTREDFAAVVGDLDVPYPELEETAEAAQVGSCVTAVAGAGGGVGATELAIEAAVALRRRGETTTLVDADLVAPSLAQRLGLPWHVNLNTAVDAVVHGTGTLAGTLVPSPTGGFDALVGIEPRKWADLDPDDLVEVLKAMSQIRQHTLAIVGPSLEDTTGGRHAGARAAVGAADRVVVAAEATPIGLERLTRWLVDAAELTDLARVHVAFSCSPGGDGAAQLDHELARAAAVAGISHIPADRKVIRARWAGDVVRRGRFTRAVGKLAAASLPRTTGTSRRRLRRKQPS